MKKDSKKSHETPLRLFVRPFASWLTLEREGYGGNLHDGQLIWQGMAVRMGRDDELYIDLAKVWHQGKELPKSDQDDCLLDYADGMTTEVGHTYTDPDGSRGWLTDSGAHLFEEISQWAYLKDIVPTKLKKGGK